MSTPEALSVPRELDTVTNLLDEHIDSLAYGNCSVQNAALQAAKHIFDTSLGTERHSRVSINNLLSSLNPLQKPITRSQAKADNSLPHTSPNKTFEPTPLSSLLIEGMDQEQVWMQLDLRSQMVCGLLDYALENGKSEEDLSAGEDDDEGDDDDRLQNLIEAIQKGEEIDLRDIHEELGEEMDVDEESAEEDDESEGSENAIDDAEHIVQLRSDDEQSDNEGSTTLFDVIKTSSRSKRRKRVDHGLNDDFFDLDAFNAEIEQAEAKSSSRGQLADEDEDSEDEEMTLDLFAPVDEEVDDPEDTGDVFYRDFFDPPRNANSWSQVKVSSNRKSKVRFHDEVRVKKIKPKGKNLPLSLLRGVDALDEDEDEDDDDDGQAGFAIDLEGEEEGSWFDDEPMEGDEISDEADERVGEGNSPSQSQASNEDDSQTMERFKDDLFAEDKEDGHDDDMTTHEKRQATLREQIAEMEDENVAKKAWTLMGEADSRSRPQNSLLEEDLEFERVMKAAPMISEEVVQGLEQKIKARILENRFDDVVRVRPLEDKPFLPSRMFEPQDTKSTQSLAQLYENDYLATQNGAGHKGDEKVKKQHEEIEKDWEKICCKLDALCNAHFVPKQPKAIISTVSNVATASMESALPTAMATSSMLAPEELFNPAKAETRSRSELSPSEKRALHTKERKAKKRQRDILEKSRNKVTKPTKGIGNLKKEKQAALNSIVKTGKGVTVVGKQTKSGSSSSKKRPQK